MKPREALFRRLTGSLLGVTVILGGALVVGNNWKDKINELTGTTTSGISRSKNASDYKFTSTFATPQDLVQAEIDLNTRLAEEGTVCLKGQPEIVGNKVTLFGMRSGDKMQFGGSMGEIINASNVVNLQSALEKEGFEVNPTMAQFYRDKEAKYSPTRSASGNMANSYDAQGSVINEVPVSEYSGDLVGDYKDAAVVVLGRDCGESSSFYPGLNGIGKASEYSKSSLKDIFALTDDEHDLINYVKAAGFSKIVVLLNSGSAMEIDDLKHDDDIDSIMWMGVPGAYGTYGVARLLSGAALPSGHLPDTFAVNSGLSPAAQNYGIFTFANIDAIEDTSNHGRRAEWYVAELEGIYTGYKYYETRYYDAEIGVGNATIGGSNESVGTNWVYDTEVSYTFGYGVEGSEFKDEILSQDIDWTGEADSTVTVKVTNEGLVAAKHSVQLYLNAPYTAEDASRGVEKPAVSLLGYAKTGEASETSYKDRVLLEPGESETVTITFNAKEAYSYDKSHAHDDVMGAYWLEEGDYYLATGNGAHEAVNAVLNEVVGGTRSTTGDAVKVELAEEKYITGSNGVLVQNQLGEGDLNSWDCGTTVNYLTRNDWHGTFPKPVSSITATQAMITKLRNLTYDAAAEKAAYKGPASFTYGAEVKYYAFELAGVAYDDPKWETFLNQLSLDFICKQYIAYLEENIDVKMPTEKRTDSPLGLIASVGQYTKGTIFEVADDNPVKGKNMNAYVGGPVVAATFSPSLQLWEGKLFGEDGLWSGINQWYGPGMNIHRTPYNGRNVAYYSEDATLTGKTGAYVNQGVNSYGLMTSVKHFAFNDQEANRDGVALFLTEQGARENELRGFEIGIREGKITGLMSAFNRIGCTHVGAHRGLMNGILRGEWGWKGFMMTDSVKSADYFRAHECLLAGNDQMLGGSAYGNKWSMNASDVEGDIVLQAALRETYHRKAYAFVNSALLNGINKDSKASASMPAWLLSIYIGLGVAATLTAASLGFYVFTLVKGRKEDHE